MTDLNDARRAATKHGWTDSEGIHHPKRRMTLSRRMSPDISLLFGDHDGAFRSGFANFGVADGFLLKDIDEALALLARPEAPAPVYLNADPKED